MMTLVQTAQSVGSISQFQQTKSIEISLRQRQNWAKANWAIFKESIDENKIDLSDLTGVSDTLRSIQNINQTIETALNAAVLIITYTAQKSPWWNPNLNWLRARLDRAERQLK
jgi:hypothetical protein